MNNKYPFLNLLSTPLDDAQTNALETVQNAVIAAGAGSGKTQVLATRFAWLVLTGQAKADEILTLTFTNKAASEMYQRIYDTLNFFANHEICPELTAEQKQLAKNGLADFSNAHIQTLDSYSSSIVRQCSNRYGIRPDFSTGSSDGLRDVKNRALKYTLNNATRLGIQSFADAGKLQNFANEKLAYAINECADITTPKGYFSSKLPVQIEEIVKALNFYISEKPIEDDSMIGKMNLSKAFENIEAEIAADNAPAKHAAYVANIRTIIDYVSSNIINHSISAEDIVNQSPEIIQLETDLENALQMFSAPQTGKMTSVNSIISNLKKTVFVALQSIFAYISNYEAIKDLFSIFDEFLEEINSAKRQSGNLSFKDITQLSAKVLLENPDIREQEISAYKKIMIDEFQDNNGSNRDLLYLLSLKKGTQIDSEKPIYPQIIIKDENGTILEDKRQADKLFFVGDEKQSIYKFRGADVSVFNELTKNDENLLIPMTYNYRSSPETIKAFNEIFKNGHNIFLSNLERIEYEAYYDKDALKNGTELPELTAENVPFHIRFVDSKYLDAQNSITSNPLNKLIPVHDQIGFYIAKQIYEMGKDSKNWSSFAILNKGRTHVSSITKYLNLFNIPYEIDLVKNIFEDGIINDFYNFLRICVYPSDVNAYAAYLCSPLCGLSEKSVEIILSNMIDIGDRNFVFNPLGEFPSALQSELTQNEYEKYLKAISFYDENKNLVLQQKLTTTLNTLWNKTGYKYETMLNAQVELCSEHFDMLFEIARNTDENNKSVAWFIDELEALKSTWASDSSDIEAGDVKYPLERSEAVQIMTIHKSKGLQFEHVFLCECTGVVFRSEDQSVFFDDYLGTTVKPENGSNNYFCILQKEFSRKKDVAEFRRLIYVGITRAIKDVYIMGEWAPNPDKSEFDKSDSHIFERVVEASYGLTVSREKQYTPGTAFDFMNLEPVTYAEVSGAGTSSNLDVCRQEKMEEIAAVYNSAEIITYHQNPIPRSCPSALESEYDSTGSEDSLKDSVRQEEIEAELRTPEFTAADFGTLVHAYLEAYVNGIEPEAFTAPAKLFKNLEEPKIQQQIKKCTDFVTLFAQTDIGKELAECKADNRFVKSEWAFKMFWDQTIWTGSIDLIFQRAKGTYLIVDYKSDEAVNPDKYVGQQNCYRKAAAKMLKVDESQIECLLWFMKTNQFITIK